MDPWTPGNRLYSPCVEQAILQVIILGLGRVSGLEVKKQVKHKLGERFPRKGHFLKTLSPVNLGEIKIPGPLAFII